MEQGSEIDVNLQTGGASAANYPTSSTPISDLLSLSTKTIGDFDKVMNFSMILKNFLVTLP